MTGPSQCPRCGSNDPKRPRVIDWGPMDLWGPCNDPWHTPAPQPAQCFHVHLSRKLAGSWAWYECDSCGEKFCPHKHDESIPMWDGKMKAMQR